MCDNVCVAEHDTSKNQREPCFFLMLDRFVRRSWCGTEVSFPCEAQAWQTPGSDTLLRLGFRKYTQYVSLSGIVNKRQKQ